MWTLDNVGLAALAGFVAGYVMTLGSYWLESVFGLVGLDFGVTGMKYVGGERPGWWAIGIIFHLIDSVLLGLAYAAFALPILSLVGLPVDQVWVGMLGGIVYGILLWIVLAMLIVMPMMGEGIFGHKTGSARLAMLSLGLHLVYGGLLGLIYIP